jgi:hypothetical protein
MVLLASLMAMIAFQQFMGALSDLAGEPAVPPPPVAGDAAPADAEVAAHMALGVAYGQALAEVPAGVSGFLGALRLAYASLLLFTVAAVATRDRRGRAAALIGAWVGIAHHLAAAAAFLLLIRPAILRRAPDWLDEVRALTRTGGQEAVSSDLVGTWAQTVLLGAPIFGAILGVGFSLLLLVFFGGRRGRSYYGLPATPATGPARTGA